LIIFKIEELFLIYFHQNSKNSPKTPKTTFRLCHNSAMPSKTRSKKKGKMKMNNWTTAGAAARFFGVFIAMIGTLALMLEYMDCLTK
jgi:hypothetical protein